MCCGNVPDFAAAAVSFKNPVFSSSCIVFGLEITYMTGLVIQRITSFMEMSLRRKVGGWNSQSRRRRVLRGRPDTNSVSFRNAVIPHISLMNEVPEAFEAILNLDCLLVHPQKEVASLSPSDVFRTLIRHLKQTEGHTRAHNERRGVAHCKLKLFFWSTNERRREGKRNG